MQMIRRGPFASLDPRMKPGETIAEGPRADGLAFLAEMRDGLRAGFERVGFEPAGAERLPHQASGGRRQRIAIARALAMRPDLFVPDEAAGSVAEADRIRAAITAGPASRAAIHRSWKRSVRSPAMAPRSGAIAPSAQLFASGPLPSRRPNTLRVRFLVGAPSKPQVPVLRSISRRTWAAAQWRSPSVVAWDARVLVPAARAVPTTSAGSAARPSSEIAGDVPVTCRARIGPAPRSPCATDGRSTGAASTCRAAPRAAGEPGARGAAAVEAAPSSAARVASPAVPGATSGWGGRSRTAACSITVVTPSCPVMPAREPRPRMPGEPCRLRDGSPPSHRVGGAPPDIEGAAASRHGRDPLVDPMEEEWVRGPAGGRSDHGHRRAAWSTRRMVTAPPRSA